MKIARPSILVSLTLLLLVCGDALAGSLYAIKQVDDRSIVLVRIDPESLESEDVGPLSTPIRPDSWIRSGGMAWDTHTQTLYLVMHSVLMTVDLQTNRVSMEDSDFISLLYGLDYDCTHADLFGVDEMGLLISIDTTTGVHESISHTPGDDTGFTGLVYNQAQDLLVGLKGQSGDLYLLDWRTGGGSSLLFSNPQPGINTNSLAYDVDRDVYWSVNSDGELYSYDPASDYQLTLRKTGLGDLRYLVYVHDNPCEPPPTSIPINYGMTDAWYDPETAGQGFLVTVFPEIRKMFLAWFTYDFDRPPDDTWAALGEPGHRWLTAQGDYAEDTANLTVFITKGGVFDSGNPPSSTDPAGDGAMTVTFEGCNSGSIVYDIESIGLTGEIRIERIALDKVTLCEQLGALTGD